MELAKQVTSLEISKKLKELGFKKESIFRWKFGYKGTIYVIYKDKLKIWGNGIDAYTASELMEYLPGCVGAGELTVKKNGYIYSCSIEENLAYDSPYVVINFEADTLADALGQMLIYLLSNNLIDGNNK